MDKKKTSVTLTIGDSPLTLETGSLAGQATSAVLARLGDTMVLATVVAGTLREDLGYFPLSVEYVERLYAGGRIKGSRWVKREGRPSDDAILTGRLIDRSIRPLFPKEYKNDVQVVVTVLSVDGENEPDILALVAVSAALAISPIPWNGPIGAVRIGLVKEKENGGKAMIINPKHTEIQLSELDIVATQTKEKTIMLEAGAQQVTEEEVVAAIEKAHTANKEIIALIEDFAKKVGTKKGTVTKDPLFYEVLQRIEKNYTQEIGSLVEKRAKKEGTGQEYEALLATIYEQEKAASQESAIDKKTLNKVVEKIFYKIIREQVLKSGKRPDGRKVDEIRPISSVVGVLPRTHGSAIFQRGTTQALTVATLGSPRLEQLIESAEGEEAKRYMHHYSMPPYSVGETGRMGVPSRREIGHGALAERALLAVVPKHEKFPYTIRVVSEILSSNGSTSMAATCGSTLALMDAGVPIEKPVSGIAMGLMTELNKDGNETDKYVILSDILGLEDFSGDMDFKVAGTDTGITAIQLDVKISGLTLKQIGEILTRAKTGRLHIMEKMLAALPEPRNKVSEFAPKIEVVKIPSEKIGELIGPGGRVIRNIIAQTGATVDVEDDGTVTVSGTTDESVKKAMTWVQGLTREVTVGEVFEDAEVKRILPFGAFVEILPGKEGMVHVSKMSPGRFVKDPGDVVKIGQKVKVKVIEVDDQGRINLSLVQEDGSAAPAPGGPSEKSTPESIPDRAPDAPRGPVRQSRPAPQGGYQNRAQDPQSAPATPGGPSAPSAHPLSMQFRRERSEEWRKKNRRGPGGSKPRFRKAHY